MKNKITLSLTTKNFWLNNKRRWCRNRSQMLKNKGRLTLHWNTISSETTFMSKMTKSVSNKVKTKDCFLKWISWPKNSMHLLTTATIRQPSLKPSKSLSETKSATIFPRLTPWRNKSRSATKKWANLKPKLMSTSTEQKNGKWLNWNWTFQKSKKLWRSCRKDWTSMKRQSQKK